MRPTLVVRLDPTVEQRAALGTTFKRCNAACNAIAQAAFREQLSNKLAPQLIVHYSIRECFGLSSQTHTFVAVLTPCRVVLYLVLSEHSGAVTAS